MLSELYSVISVEVDKSFNFVNRINAIIYQNAFLKIDQCTTKIY
jgi:hypothetical protein